MLHESFKVIVLALVILLALYVLGSKLGSKLGIKLGITSNSTPKEYSVADYASVDHKDISYAEMPPVEQSVIPQVDTLGRAVDGLNYLNKKQLTDIHHSLEDMVGNEQPSSWITPQRGGSRMLGGEVDNIVYSGDLVNLVANRHKMVLKKGNSYVTALHVLDNTTPDNLFKFRLELNNGHNELKRVPIMYNDAVKMAYNDDQAQTVYLNGEEVLNSLKLGNTDNTDTFRLVPVDTTTSGPVQYGQSFKIQRVGSSNTYLRISDKDDHKVYTDAIEKDATLFKLKAKAGCGPLWRLK
jgi:hypothetical protein